MTPTDILCTLIAVVVILIVVRKGDIVLSFKAPWLQFFVGAKERDRDVRRHR